ncbi:30S ribosomal protein S7 [Candidatus Bathyarchaeota archaeon]|nr:30S ribosomal protein S7 [Candidatus Bathyarchaeota archaeon]MCK4474269.1 30S ribosomal protein S7 [Candidatus Bathyarchaeota archaeon]
MKSLSRKQGTDIKLFGRWSFQGVEANDPGLRRCMSLKPVAIPHSMGRHEHKRFRKADVDIVERLLNNIMRPGKNAGKKTKAISILKNSFELINIRTGRNPIEVLVRAVENSAPCEDTTRLSYGGIAYRLSVDVAPLRRVDLALRNLCNGARQASINNPRSIEECLAEELILASNHDMKSNAVSKRHEIERIAKASR